MSLLKITAVASLLAACAALHPAIGQVAPGDVPGAQPPVQSPPVEPPSVLHPATRPAQDDASADLGPTFESEAAAITFRIPKGMTRQPRVIGGADSDKVADYVDLAKKHRLTLTQLVFQQEVPLATPKDGIQIGLLERRTDAMKEAAGAEILKSDLYTVGFRSAKDMPDSGLIAVRYSAGTADLMSQEAIIQVSKYEYYLIDYTVPGSKAGGGTDHVSDEERDAAKTFMAIVDSVKIVDRSEVIRDQRERLYATRFLFFANLTPNRVRNALRGEQWFRIVKDGKELGYSYVVEEEAEKNKRPGVTIGVRSRVVENGEQTDAESFYFVAFDRSYEEWSTVSQVNGGKGGPRNMTEVGVSNKTERNVLDVDAQRQGLRDPKDKSNPPTLPEMDYDLTVAYSGRQSTPPVEQKLPVFYLPQAMIHLLPRLVPLNEPKGYLFGVYVSDVRAVMREYLDVEREGNYLFDGKVIRAVPVKDRIGLTGQPTIHYMSRDGKYLGSVNESAHMLIVPTDAATLEKLWAKPDLSKPKPARPPGGSLTPGR
jgi:hypothetical protein